jgi:hypothetical protein
MGRPPKKVFYNQEADEQVEAEQEVEVEQEDETSAQSYEEQIEALKAALKSKDKEITKLQKGSEGTVQTKNGFAVASIEPTTAFHQTLWDKKEILKASRIKMTFEEAGKEDLIIVNFTTLYSPKTGTWETRERHIAHLPMNDHKKAFKRLFQWCDTLDEAVELSKSIK